MAKKKIKMFVNVKNQIFHFCEHWMLVEFCRDIDFNRIVFFVQIVAKVVITL